MGCANPSLTGRWEASDEAGKTRDNRHYAISGFSIQYRDGANPETQFHQDDARHCTRNRSFAGTRDVAGYHCAAPANTLRGRLVAAPCRLPSQFPEGPGGVSPQKPASGGLCLILAQERVGESKGRAKNDVQHQRHGSAHHSEIQPE